MHPQQMMFSPYSTPSPPSVSSAESRKMKKPLMEKRRRKRINDSLTWLKENLIHVAPHQRSKLEKADILEMTIDYIKMLQAGQAGLPNSTQSAYRRGMHDGFSAASKSTFEFLNVAFPANSPGGQQMQASLLRHLSASCTALIPSSSSTSPTGTAQAPPSTSPSESPVPPPSAPAPPIAPSSPSSLSSVPPASSPKETEDEEEHIDVTTPDEPPKKVFKIWRPQFV